MAARAMEDGFDYLDAPVARVTNVDVPLPYANNLEARARHDGGRDRATVRQGLLSLIPQLEPEDFGPQVAGLVVQSRFCVVAAGFTRRFKERVRGAPADRRRAGMR